MRVQNARGEVFEAELSTDHAASSYGQPVLVVAGLVALGPGDLMGLRIIEATEGERADLAEAGFPGVQP